MYPQQQNNYYNPYARAQVPANNIIWVQGIEGAKAQQIQPNSSLLLLDSESDHFYMKVCDQYGICMPIKIYKFEEEIPAATAPTMGPGAAVAAQDMSQYVTKEELEALLKEWRIHEQSVSTNTSKYTTVKQSSTND